MTYKLFSNCIVVKGFLKSIIVDIQRNSFKNIPNSLSIILLENKILDFEKLSIEYNNPKVINEYKKFLLQNEFIFECLEDELVNFPNILTKFFKPYKITNAVIEYSDLITDKINEIKNSFDNFGIQDCVFIFYCSNFDNKLNEILEIFDDSRLLSIQLIMSCQNKSKIKSFIKKQPRITSIVLYSSNIEKTEVYDNVIIRYVKNQFYDFKFCGVINNNFSINTNTYLESFNHNSCLHKKISIDINGNIRNCPSMPQSFGNIKDTTLEHALEHPDFKKYWNITKDQIEVCKDCEFRHICTDCRAYTERTHFQEDIDLSKPLKCGYNPYTNEWAEWSTNPLKQKAIEYYGMQELVKKDA